MSSFICSGCGELGFLSVYSELPICTRCAGFLRGENVRISLAIVKKLLAWQEEQNKSLPSLGINVSDGLSTGEELA